MTPRRTVTLTAIAMLCFAANSLLCRGALAGGRIDAASFTLVRFLSGAVVLGLIARTRHRPAPAERLAWGSAIALFVYAIGFSLAYLRIPAGTGALILFAAIQFTMIGGGIWSGERPRLAEWIGLAMSLTGLLVLTLRGQSRPDPVGALLMLAAGIGSGIYSFRGRRFADAVVGNAAIFVRTIPMAIVVSGIAWARNALHAEPSGIALALVSGVATTGVGYAIWYMALRGLTATRAAIVQLIVPVIAAVGGVAILGEHFTPRLLIAGVLIVGGIALATARRRPT